MKSWGKDSRGFQREHGPILLVFALLLIARVLGIISVYFFEEDEVSLAVGAAALVTDTPGGLYRYTVQLGYYRLIEWLDVLLGSRLHLIPAIMKGLSAAAGALIPALGFFAFRNELTVRERWLAVLALTTNPIIWRSSQYGNTAIIAAALATVALVMLSNRPARLTQVVALTLFGIATLVRADTVLLAPVLLALLYRNSRSLVAALTWSAAFGACVLLVYATVLLVDPRADSPMQSLATHMTIPRPTLFWEYFLWAMSPIPFVFALWGIRSLLDSRTRLLGFLFLWCLPTLLFYFRATTTTRYFINAAVPLAIAAAVGMSELIDRLKVRVRASVAWTTTIGATTLHLFLALGHVPPDRPLELFYVGTFTTDDGPMPTGALLVRTYLPVGSLLRSLPNPTFGEKSYPFWEGASFRKAISVLSDPKAPRRTVIVILGGGFGHAFHYHTQLARARFTSVPKGKLLWEGEVWLELGNVRVMTIAGWTEDYRAHPRFDVTPGDEIWRVGTTPFPDETALAKMPPGLALMPIPSFDERIHTFSVIAR